MPRFVVLEHDHPEIHWDLMLESGPVLRSWRLAEMPVPGRSVPAEPSFDHRLFYLDYEGPVSNNRGTVVRRASGTFRWVEENAEKVSVVFVGDAVSGPATLSKADDGRWTFELMEERNG
jgi:hypothetical protein